MLLIPEKLHLLLVSKGEEFLALCKDLAHEFLAYPMIDNVEKTRIQACLKKHDDHIGKNEKTKTKS